MAIKARRDSILEVAEMISDMLVREGRFQDLRITGGDNPLALGKQ